MFKFKLSNRQKYLDNMKINGVSCSPKLGVLLPGKDADMFYIFVVSAFKQCLVYQIKAGSFPDRMISNMM